MRLRYVNEVLFSILVLFLLTTTEPKYEKETQSVEDDSELENRFVNVFHFENGIGRRRTSPSFCGGVCVCAVYAFLCTQSQFRDRTK